MKPKPKTASKRISNILVSGSSGLQTVLEKAAILRHLTSVLRQQLPSPLNQHVCVANIRNHTLVIGADSSAWLTKTRFQSSAILKSIRQETGLKLTKVHFKVISSAIHDDTLVNRQPTMSENSAAIIDSTARGVQDPTLKQALKRLSRNKNS